MRKENAILDSLERIWRQIWPMDSGIRVALCKRCNRRLLDQVFESKPIKRGGKIPLWQPKKSLKFQSNSTNNMFTQNTNNNTYTMASASPNPYISRKLNNMDQAQVMKRERGLGKNVPQDIEGIGSNDWCSKDNKGYEEISRRNQYNSHRNGRDDSNSQYQ